PWLPLVTRAWVRPGPRPRVLVKFACCGKQSSEALAKPSSDLSEITVRPCLELPRMPRFDMFEVSVLRVDQQAGRRREGSGLGLVGKAAEAERTADTHRPVEDLGGELRDTGELRGAAAEHDAGLRLRREGGILEPVAHHFENLLDAVLDDVRNRGT